MNATNAAMPPTSGTKIAGAAPAVVRLLDQREDDPAQPEHAQHRADEVDAPAADAGVAGTAARISTSVTTTSGMLSAKIQRHETWSTI